MPSEAGPVWGSCWSETFCAVLNNCTPAACSPESRKAFIVAMLGAPLSVKTNSDFGDAALMRAIAGR